MQYSSARKKPVSIIATIGAVALYGSILAGQLVRFPVFQQSGGLLSSDVAVCFFIGVVVSLAMFGLIAPRAIYRAAWAYAVLFSPFFIYSLGVLIAHTQFLTNHEFAIAALYWLRLWVISLLLPACWVLIWGYGSKKVLMYGFITTYVGLLLLGYAQLLLFPSLVGNVNGWDPHIHRMIATWFDPNFFGGYIALCIFPVFIWSKGNIPLAIAGLGALILTESRSAWVAFVVACMMVLAVWLLRSHLAFHWKKGLALSFLLFGVVVVAVVGTASDRVALLLTHDPTASLRINSYALTWHRLVEPNIIFGVGYNAYQFYAKQAGLIQDFSIHSRAGSDSSVITLLVTTGIIGTTLFFIPFIIGIWLHVAKWFAGASREHLIMLWLVVVLLVHAQFENSLLYPHILIAAALLSSLIPL